MVMTVLRAGVYQMLIENIEKEEWLGLMQEDAILFGAFEPSLTQITMEIECRECGRPVYISPQEKGDATVICIICGLKYFNDPDREILRKALIPAAQTHEGTHN
jgi:hypothetical protein